MIDWINAVLPYPHDVAILGGACQYLAPEPTGDHSEPVETPHGVMYVVGTTQRKAMVRGSFDSKVAIQTSNGHKTGTHIWISGSPKPLQGHNLFGSDDPRLLAAHLARFALESFGLMVDPFTWRGWLEGNRVKFTRIDITQMLDTGSEHNAAEWLNAVATYGHMRRRGTGDNDSGTVYFGKRSRRSALKLYRKFVELQSRSKSHRLPESIPMYDKLLEYARGTVRAEWTLHSQELQRLCLDRGETWKSVHALDVWKSLMEKLDIPGNFPLDPFDLETLPRSTRAVYRDWHSGTDIKQAYPKATYFRHRSLLKRYGIDIATPCNRRGNVRPLIRVIEARPKQIPVWAQSTPLLYAA